MPMDDQRWFNVMTSALVVLVVLFGAAMVLLPRPATTPTASAHTSSGGPTVYRNLSIALDPRTGAFDYIALQLSVPAGVRVVFTITNFDPSTSALPWANDARVFGTLGNTESLSGYGSVVSVGALSSSGVSHTFSLSNAEYHINAPIPPAAGGPVHVTFSVDFPVPGTFGWGCVILCGPAEMMAQAGMYGTITVS